MFQNSKSGLLVLMALLFSLGPFLPAVAADDYMPETFTAAQFAEYERQLNALLKTRADEEKQFVSLVVTQVRLGRIPSRLVSTSYQWGRKNRPATNYPFIYFEKVIRIQAKALKLEDEIPPFDYSIYKSAGQRSEGQKASAGQRTQANRNFFSRPLKIFR
jgi:hypothetical protein